MKKYDVSALGEILIDFTYSGVGTDGQTLFAQNPGGAPANVLAAIQKLGGKTAFIGKVGDDMHGRFLKETLDNIGVFSKGLVLDKNVFTTLAFVNLSPDGERSFSFARKPGADTMLESSEVDYNLIGQSKILHIGSLSLTDEPSRGATISAVKYAKENGITVSYDPNYRKMLWKDEKTAKDMMRSVLEYVDIIKISDEETKLLTDKEKAEDAADELVKKGISCCIVTLGKDGAYIKTKDSFVKISAMGDKVVDTTGAGDSFMGGFLYMMTSENKEPKNLTFEDIKKYGEFASKVAGYCVSKKGAINAMPTLDQIK